MWGQARLRLTLRRRVLFFAGVWLLGMAWGNGVACAQSTVQDATQPRAYLHGIEDLPLMPELTELEGAGIVFDKPAGRIVLSMAQGQVTTKEVLAFYADTLPQLGWRMEGANRFHREGEVLHIEFEADVSPLLVRFSLAPKK